MSLVNKLAEKIKTLFNLDLVMIQNENQIEHKLVDRKQMLVDNNISCRRIAKEKIIKEFILNNHFVRGLMAGEVPKLRSEAAFKEKRPREMVNRELG